MKKRVLSTALAAIMCAAVLSGCGGDKPAETPAEGTEATEGTESTEGADAGAAAEGEYAMISGTTTPDAHPYNLGLVKLSELLSEKTGGAVTLDVFGNSQLGGERDLIEGLQLGTVQMTCVSTAPLSGFTDMFLVFDLPFIFETTEIARAVMDSEVGTEILHSVDEQGLVGLAWFENGFRNVTNNKGPIEKPEDLKGVKIRTMENPMHMAAFSVMGADPTPMAMGEVFTALQQGTIDAQENPVPIIETNKFDEVQKYISMTGHLYSPAPVFVAKDYFEALPAEYQTALQEAADEAVPYQREQIDIQTEEGLKALEERGMVANYPEKAAFKEATASIYTDYVKEGAGFVSPEIYARVEEVIASVGSGSDAGDETAPEEAPADDAAADEAAAE